MTAQHITQALQRGASVQASAYGGSSAPVQEALEEAGRLWVRHAGQAYYFAPATVTIDGARHSTR